MTEVAILWHMHQPSYQDLVTGEHILPWVRLHGLKDYYGMVALLREFPDVRVTFNLVPSLLVQIEAFAEARARDRYLDLSLKPAASLTTDEIGFILRNFFHAQRQRMIEPYPRYAELLERRGGSIPTAADLRVAADRFAVDDLRDLQVWHKLAWVDPGYLEEDGRVRDLVTKGRNFTEDDKAQLRAVELEILNRIVPEYRGAAARGQIEISTSPFYHPILPLLCDTDVYLTTHPDSRMPRRRFEHPEDAAEQLARAVECHERLFGRQPVGLWPSEGSVSDAMAPLAAAAGFQWMATDEQILARTLDAAFVRDDRGVLTDPERLYAAYRLETGGAGIVCAFRDHALSDLIGFTYAGWGSEAAADDFVRRLADAGRRFQERRGSDADPCRIFVILDGENAWEHFEGGGRPFLRALYGRLSSHPELRTVTMAEACARPTATLAHIFPGSWIDANFYIWIGHADDQKAWGQLADARDILPAGPGPWPDAQARAREEILIAEGSDWFWWYGDDHSSEHDAEFDDLFRRHLRNAYRLLGLAIPDELFVSNISAAARPPAETQPVSLIRPVIDGADTSYFEWLHAGLVEIRQTGGAMHQAEQAAPLVTVIRFGCDMERLYVRVDAARPVVDLLGAGYEFSLKFLVPDGLRYSVTLVEGRLTGAYWARKGSDSATRLQRADRHAAGTRTGIGDPLWLTIGAGAATVGAGAILEIALPFTDLGVGPGAPLAFFVAVYEPGPVERERHPSQRPIETEVPNAGFTARHWNA